MVLEFRGVSESTPDEVWQTERTPGGHYAAAADFALQYLDGPGRCLVVASPIFEVYELAERYRVTYLDFRRPPVNGFDYVEGDACALPFEDATFDALSSTCLLCHLGLGRYGDPQRLGADQIALREFHRVLRPGGSAAIMLGPVAEIAESQALGTAHRVYTMRHAAAILEQAGFSTRYAAVWDTRGERWRRPGEAINVDPALFPDYLSVYVEKPTCNT